MIKNIDAHFHLQINEFMAPIQDLYAYEALERDKQRLPLETSSGTTVDKIPSLEEAFKIDNPQLVKDYIDIVLNRLFPKYSVEDLIYQGPYDPSEIIDFEDDRNKLVCVRPYEVDLDTDLVKSEVSFKVNVEFKILQDKRDKPYKIADIAITYQDSMDMNNLFNYILKPASIETFFRTVYLTLNCSNFFELFLKKNDTYVTINNITLQPLSPYQFEDLNIIKHHMVNMEPLPENVRGHLIPLDETHSFSSYDGSGHYCKEENGVMMESGIIFDADYPIPELYQNHFTHVLWYNR